MPALSTLGKGSSDTLTILLHRSVETSHQLLKRSPSVKAQRSAAVLVIFCLIFSSLGIGVWWFFIRRRDGGFIWKASDWDDYRSSVLRRPEERPDDAITVFADGTSRRGGSTVGARTVVLGELDTTYSKSQVLSEKSWGRSKVKAAKKLKDLRVHRRDQNGGSIWGSVWGKGESIWGTGDGSVWQKIRPGRGRRKNQGEGFESGYDTEAQRRKEMDLDASSDEEMYSYVDREVPAPPLTDWGRSTEYTGGSSDMTTSRVFSDLNQKSRRETAYDPAPHRTSYKGKRAQSPESELSSSSESETDSDDDESITASDIGLAKGNKVYHHPIGGSSGQGQSRVFLPPRPIVERGSGNLAGYSSPASSAVGRTRGYRAGSHGSLSSEGSVQSSNDGR